MFVRVSDVAVFVIADVWIVRLAQLVASTGKQTVSTRVDTQ